MLEEIIKERKRKASDIKDAGINPYPAISKRTEIIGDIVSGFSKFEKNKKKFYITGRIRSLRDQGKILFIDLEDFSGKIQVVARKDDLKNFQIIKKDVDMGDFLRERVCI
jgi:lysyl-tRNA synthetase class 2